MELLGIKKTYVDGLQMVTVTTDAKSAKSANFLSVLATSMAAYTFWLDSSQGMPLATSCDMIQ